MKVVIVHGSNPKGKENLARGEPNLNEKHWLPWLKEKLEEKGIEVFNPLMPEHWNPSYSEWKKEFEKLVLDYDTILIGHSAGAGFLTRWIQETGKKFRKLILVAPGRVVDENNLYLKAFYGPELDEKIKDNFEEIVIFLQIMIPKELWKV